MLSKPPEQLPAVLFVDDEAKTCKHFKRLFSPRFRILTAHDGIEGMNIFREQCDEIGIIMTDQRMPNETGTEFLEKAARLKPSVKRIISTAYADVDAAVDAVNNSGIYRYITKPWEVPELEMTLIRAMEVYLLEQEREKLLGQKVAELGALAALERVHGFAALSVFKDNKLRHVAHAIGSLIQLGRPEEFQIEPDQWEHIYQSHRQFLDLTHTTLPESISQGAAFDPTQPVCPEKFCAAISNRHPQLKVHPTERTGNDLPGPLKTLVARFDHLINGLISILGEHDLIHLHLTAAGLTLTLPSPPIENALQPLFSNQKVSENDLKPCLEIAAVVLNWHHHGGQLVLSRSGESLGIRLDFLTPSASPDPWRDLAADLIGNTSFWKNQT